jgi:hypothetical protein
MLAGIAVNCPALFSNRGRTVHGAHVGRHENDTRQHLTYYIYIENFYVERKTTF